MPIKHTIIETIDKDDYGFHTCSCGKKFFWNHFYEDSEIYEHMEKENKKKVEKKDE